MTKDDGSTMLAIKAVFLGPRRLMRKQDSGEDRNVTLWRMEATSAEKRNLELNDVI